MNAAQNAIDFLTDGTDLAAPSSIGWSYQDDFSIGSVNILLERDVVATIVGVKQTSHIGTEVSAEADRVKADRIQVSYHSASRMSVQFFRSDVLVSDCNYSRVG